jgi:hypothetical protein
MKLKQIVLLLALVPMIVPVGLHAAGHSDTGCKSCHAPHHAQDLPGVPLWNGTETTKTFTLYSSATLDATVGQPDGSSKLCLGCHDGSLAAIAGSSMDFGSDLSTSHPISFTYDSALAIADPDLKDPGDPSSLGSTIEIDLLDGTSKVQCTSCHDVHSSGIGTSFLRGYDYFDGFGGGDLCRMCHEK